MPPTSLVKLLDGDDFIQHLERGKKSDPSILIPDSMEPRDVLACVSKCTAAILSLEKPLYALTPILGRLMARVAKDRLWEMEGYESLSQYEKERLEDRGVSRATIWAAKKIYEVFSDLPIEEYVEIGTPKLTIAAKVSKESSPAQKKNLLDKARELPVEQFRDFVEKESGLSAPGATRGAAFELIGSAEEVGELKAHLADARFREFSGDDRPIAMVLAAIQESTSLWPTEGGSGSKWGKKEKTDW